MVDRAVSLDGQCASGRHGEALTFTCAYLIPCTGYYNHDQGYLPDFPGQERFKGLRVHPQHWPEELDYRGKRVVVIGSGQRP